MNNNFSPPTKHINARLIIGIILILLSIIPLYNSLIYFQPLLGSVIFSSKILNFRELGFLSAPLFISGYFLIFKRFAFRPIRLILLSTLGYSILSLGIAAFVFYLRSPGGELWALSLISLLITIILTFIGITLVIIVGIKTRKYEKTLTQPYQKDRLPSLILKILFLLAVVISPFFIFRAQQSSMALSKIKTSSDEIYSDPNQNPIRIYDQNENLTYYNIKTGKMKIDIPEDELFATGSWSPYDYIHEPITENKNYKWEHTYILDKSTNIKYKFPVDDVYNCQFFLNGEYSTCFQYENYDFKYLYTVPTNNIIKK